MSADISLVFDDVGSVLESYSDMSLPTWDELPDIPLYMDQVIGLLDRYLKIEIPALKSDMAKDYQDNHNRMLTSSMVNNYVKMGIMPAPEKKKYSRSHIAYLLMICLLKQSLSISVLGVFIQSQVDSMGIEGFYNLFVSYYINYFKKYIGDLVTIYSEIFHGDSPANTHQAVMGIVAAACANAGKLTCDTADVVIHIEKEEQKKREEKEKHEEKHDAKHDEKKDEKKDEEKDKKKDEEKDKK